MFVLFELLETCLSNIFLNRFEFNEDQESQTDLPFCDLQALSECLHCL